MEPTADLIIIREIHTPTSTIGELFVFDQFFSYTLEDSIRASDIKVPGFTGLPAGWYKVKLTWSPRFQRMLPLIYNLSDFSIKANGIRFTGVRFHGGNDHFSTDACVLVAANKKEVKSAITTNGKTRNYTDYVVWGSMSDALCAQLDPEKEYTLQIKNGTLQTNIKAQ